MTTTTIESELLELEEQYWQAIKNKDADTAMRLSDEPAIVTGAQGVAQLDRTTMAKMIRNATYTLHKFEIKDGAQVRLLSDDVAVVAYNVHEELTVDGKPVTLEAADSSVWVRKNGRWVCTLHTESLAGDPFGRDRHQAK